MVRSFSLIHIFEKEFSTSFVIIDMFFQVWDLITCFFLCDWLDIYMYILYITLVLLTIITISYQHKNNTLLTYVDGLVQERHNYIANALELRLSYTNPSISFVIVFHSELHPESSHPEFIYKMQFTGWNAAVNQIADILQQHFQMKFLEWKCFYILQFSVKFVPKKCVDQL